MSLQAIKTGFKATILATSCCSLPILLAMIFSVLGVGSMTAALQIPKYKYYFIAFGSVFLLASIYSSIKKKCGGTCSIADVKRQKQVVIVSILTYVTLTVLTIYLILPMISSLLFG